MLVFPKWKLSALWEARMSEGNQKCWKRITMANKGSSSLEQGKPVSHSETRHLVFLCSRHICPEANGKTLWVWWGNHQWRWKWTSIFLVYKHRVIRISAQELEKTPSLVGTRPVRARGTNSGPFLTRRIKSVGDPKQQGMLFFGTHVRLRGWNQ